MDRLAEARPASAFPPARRGLRRFGAAALAVSLAIAAGPARAAEADDGPALGEAMDRLGWRLVSTLTEADGEANVLVSPWGLASVLAVLDLGAADDDKGALAEAWTGEAVAADAVLEAMSGMRAALGDSATDGAAFQDANGIWVASPMVVKPDTAEAAEGALEVQVASVDFADPATAKALNAWAEARTDGAIPVLLAQVDPALRAVVANALHYKAPWEHPFAPAQTQPGVFVTEGGDELPATFMRGVFPDLAVESTDLFDRVALPLGDGATSLRLTLPTEGHGLDDVLDEMLAAEEDDTPIEPRAGQVVSLSVPRFGVTAGGDLTDALTAIGLGLLFDGSVDFSNLADGLNRFDHLHQRVRLALDEAGLEAAAVTVATSVRGMPQDADLSLVFDRPFLVDLVHGPSGAVLLSGAVTHPEDEAADVDANPAPDEDGAAGEDSDDEGSAEDAPSEEAPSEEAPAEAAPQ